jgi:uncharacterized membrane protein YqiK
LLLLLLLLLLLVVLLLLLLLLLFKLGSCRRKCGAQNMVIDSATESTIVW